MPPYLTDLRIWADLWPIFLFAGFSSLLLTLGSSGWAIGRTAVRRAFIVVFSFSLLGIVTGQVTGLSRDAAVGAVLPAVLSLIGGVMIYLIGTKGPRTQAFVAVAVVGLTANLLVGIYWGAKTRFVFEEFKMSSDRMIIRAVTEEAVKRRVSTIRENTNRTIALLRLKYYAEIAKLHSKIQTQEGIEFPLPIPAPETKVGDSQKKD